MRIGSAWETKWLDLFVAVNMLLLTAMGLLVYMDRFIAKRGEGHIPEFFFYGIVIAGIVAIAWWYLRKFNFQLKHLAIIEVGILMHFAGGLVLFSGEPLYRCAILGIGYDKYVHFVNSFAGMIAVSEIFRALGYKLGKIEWLVFVLIVLGCGAVVEIVEYVAKKVINKTMVGEYDNNMQDLIANSVGSFAYLLYRRVVVAISEPRGDGG